MIKQYDSIAALCDDFVARGKPSPDFMGPADPSIIARGYSGDTSLVPEAELFTKQFENTIETPRLSWSPSVAGGICVVPEYLAGVPSHMRIRTKVPTNNAPITIIVGTASSGSINRQIFLKRGITILSLVMLLARFRAISLHIMDPGYGTDKDGETVIMAKVNTTPLDLATAAYVLTEIAFTRTVMYGIEFQITGRITWPQNYGSEYYHKLALRMGLNPSDTLVIRDAYAGDTLITKPVEWVKQQIAFFIGQQED